MTLKKFLYSIIPTVAAAVACLTSCDYLDIVPPEQPNIDDAMSTHDRALGFLYSCYQGCNEDNPVAYLGEIASSTDEYVLPYQWSSNAKSLMTDNVNSNSQVWIWGQTYRFVGQCYLFLQKLEEIGIPNGVASEAEVEQWRAECNFLVAWYHFMTLRRYGPIPITDSYIPMGTPSSQYNGRSHFDYCVDWIANKLDEAAEGLPARREGTEWGRATSVMAKAVKARLLLYAASPLWNGSFPYPEWKNTNFETPGYGLDLVSNTYSREKWERALKANQEALTLALGEGQRELYDDEEYYSRQQLDLPYVPYKDPEDPEDQAFLKKVMKMRYAVSTRESEGNKEIIWGLSNQFDFYSRYPQNILKLSNGTWQNGYQGISPTLYTVEHFYTENGMIPAQDSRFYAESEWLQSSNIEGREDIIKLNTRREPRFYAWMAFDGGDYGSKFSAGKPLTLDMKDPQKQGYIPQTNGNHSTTGYLTQKYVDPMTNFDVNGGLSGTTSAPTILFRLAELYLNVAECQAELGNTQGALEALKPVRERAGVPALTEQMVNESGMSIVEWVRNERFVELWNEGHRFFDVRRWMKGEEYFGFGKREGLNGEVQDPSFTEFNKRVPLTKYPYKWAKRMYLYPVFYNEVYKNPQMVQAPGY